MTLQELNESYDQYILEKDYIAEGLLFFKKSKKLYDYANKLDKKIIVLKDVGKPEDVETLQKLSNDLKALADNFKEVEDSFRSREISKEEAKQRLKQLQQQNTEILNTVKKESIKSTLKKIGLFGLLGGLVASLTGLAIPAGLIQAIGGAISSTSGVVSNAVVDTSEKIKNVLNK